jgi:hypothetical protein
MEEITEMISQLPFGQAVQRINITQLPQEIKEDIISKTTGILNETETSSDINAMREKSRSILDETEDETETTATDPMIRSISRNRIVAEQLEALADNLEARIKSKRGLRKILDGRPMEQ